MDVAVPSLTPAETANLAEITSVKTKTDQLEFTGTDLKATLDGEEVVTDTASRNASKADVSSLSTFDPVNDTVANVTLVATTTTNTDMRGTDGANTIAPTTAPTVSEIRAGFVADDFKATTTISSNMRGTDGANTVAPITPPTVVQIRAGFVADDFKATGFSTFDSSADTVITDTASRNASKADVTGLSTFNPATDNIAELTAYTASALPKIRAILIDTDDLFTNQSNWLTANVSGLSTFDYTTDAVTVAGGGGGGTAGLTPAQAAELTAVKAKTDLLNFTGDDVKATLDGEVVVTDETSRIESRALQNAT